MVEAQDKLMSQKEVQGLEVLRRMQQDGLGQSHAAQQLGVSVRQVKRLVRRLRAHGAQGLVSVNVCAGWPTASNRNAACNRPRTGPCG